MLARRDLARRHEAAARLQKVVRRMLQRKAYEHTTRAVDAIQRVVMGKVQRNRMARLAQTVLHAQRLFRSVSAYYLRYACVC